ncbi:MAG: hypothetical protein ACXWUN_01065 [Allosphingosinicella sp.]
MTVHQPFPRFEADAAPGGARRLPVSFVPQLPGIDARQSETLLPFPLAEECYGPFLPETENGPAADEALSEDEAEQIRRNMLLEIESALQAEDSEIASFHVGLATVYAKRLVALGRTAGDV